MTLLIQTMSKSKYAKQQMHVTVRIRPLSQRQIREDPRVCLSIQRNNSLQIILGSNLKKFMFDSVCYNNSQQQMFERVGKKCTQDCIEGYNVTVFAYGQTGAGKTYTMMGFNEEHQYYWQNRGLIPRTMEYLFQCISKKQQIGELFQVQCSFLEIYNEQINDLLNKSNNNLQIREDSRKGVYVQGITKQIIKQSDQAINLFNKGSKSRQVGSTYYNQVSSRSHSVFILQIKSTYNTNGVTQTQNRQFNFIDLAGSQRMKRITGERLKEGCDINKSLMNLSTVISALSRYSQNKIPHISYRNSKLTFLLKDCLRGNSKTNLIANISPATASYRQTLSTLAFAQRAKLIKREKATIKLHSSINLSPIKSQISDQKEQFSLANISFDNLSINQDQKFYEIVCKIQTFMEQEVEKQKYLQKEMIGLNKKIIYLQKGVQHFNLNEIHLRLIITIYEDKLSRLEQVSKTINLHLKSIPETALQNKIVMQYIQKQRNSFMKMFDCLKGQFYKGDLMYQILKQAKIIRKQFEDKRLQQLVKVNTTYLSSLHNLLCQITQKKALLKRSQQFQASIKLLKAQYQQKNEGLNLQIFNLQTRNQETQKLLQETIYSHNILQQQIIGILQTKKLLQDQISQYQQSHKKYALQQTQSKNALKQQIENKQIQIVKLNHELKTNELSLDESYANQVKLKDHINILEEAMIQFKKQAQQKNQQLLNYNQDIQLYQKEVESLKMQNHQLNIDLVSLKQRYDNQVLTLEQTHKNKIEQMSACHDEQRNRLQQIIQGQAYNLKKTLQELKLVHQQHNFIKASKQSQQKQQLQFIKTLLESKDKTIETLQKQNYVLQKQKKHYSEQTMALKTIINQLNIECQAYKQKMKNYQAYHEIVSKQVQQMHFWKRQSLTYSNQIQNMQRQIERYKASEIQVLAQLQTLKDINKDLQSQIENKQKLNSELKSQLYGSEHSYRKLLTKINSKRQKTKDHLKPIQLSQKSNKQKANLRSENQDLSKVVGQMRETIKQKQGQIKLAEVSRQQLYSSMQKYVDEIQKQYHELAKDHKILIQQRKLYQRQSQDNQFLKEQVRTLRINSAKIAYKNENMQTKIKRANFDSILLQKEYKEIKKNDSLSNNYDEKTLYINRLKAQIATLKTQRALLSESLAKQRQQKARIKANKEKQSNYIKQQLQKKSMQSQNQINFILEIRDRLGIYRSFPQIKLQNIRQMIINAINQKNTQVNNLKQKIKNQQLQNYSSVKCNYSIDRQNLQNKHLILMEKKTNAINEEKNRRYLTQTVPKCLNSLSVKINTYGKLSQWSNKKKNTFI